MPAGDRIDFIREMCTGMWVPMDISFDRLCERADVDLAGEFQASGTGAMQVVVMDIMPITVHRTERHIAQAAPDLLKAYLVGGGGPVVIAQGGSQAVPNACHRRGGRAHLAVPAAARPQRRPLHARRSGAAIFLCAGGARHQAGT